MEDEWHPTVPWTRYLAWEAWVREGMLREVNQINVNAPALTLGVSTLPNPYYGQGGLQFLRVQRTSSTSFELESIISTAKLVLDRLTLLQTYLWTWFSCWSGFQTDLWLHGASIRQSCLKGGSKIKGVALRRQKILLINYSWRVWSMITS